MALFWAIVSSVLLVFLILLFARFVVDWVMVLARSWRPSGVVAAGLEVVYTHHRPAAEGGAPGHPAAEPRAPSGWTSGFMVLLIAVVILRGIASGLALTACAMMPAQRSATGTSVLRTALQPPVPPYH